MTQEERRLLDSKTRLFDAAIAFTDELRAGHPFQFDCERAMLFAAMDYAETVHFVEWSRHQTAKEREERTTAKTKEEEKRG